MVTLLTIVHVLACIFLMLTVLLQAGKGGGVGVALGGQTSAQVFGGRGAGTFLERLTAGTAIVFMLTSMTLAYIASKSDSARLQKLAAEQAQKKKKDDQKSADDKAAKDAEDRAKGQKGDEATHEPAEESGEEATPEATPPAPAPAPKAEPKAEPAPKAEKKAVEKKVVEKKAVEKKAAPPEKKSEETEAPAE